MSEPTLKLPTGADALLADFPMTEPDFEAQAKAIEARLASASGNGVANDLLKAPELAPEPGEPAAGSSTRAASAPKGSFAEMARRSLQKKDDEAAAIARELLVMTAQSRRPNAELVERVRAAGRAPASTTPLPVDGAAEDAPRPSGVITRAAASPVVASKQPEPMNRGTLIGIAGTLLAIAASVALFMKSEPAPSPPSAALVVDASARRAPSVEAPGSAAAAAAKPTDVKRLEDLAEATSPRSSEARAAAATKPSAGAAAAVGAGKANPAPAASALSVLLEEETEPLEPAVGEAKPKGPEPQLQPAHGSSGDVPLTPSAGAVGTALGSVRSNAQACLAGQTTAVTATVTFAADGRVLRVNAGGPSGACIQSALAKARIAPFARESFSATTTIRPP
jgi:hypothetical protein